MKDATSLRVSVNSCVSAVRPRMEEVARNEALGALEKSTLAALKELRRLEGFTQAAEPDNGALPSSL